MWPESNIRPVIRRIRFFFPPFGWFKPSGHSGGTANQVVVATSELVGAQTLWQTNRDKLHSKCMGNADRILEMHFFEMQYIYSFSDRGYFHIVCWFSVAVAACLLVASLAQSVSFSLHKLPHQFITSGLFVG